MPVSTDHFNSVQDLIKHQLGGECQVCGSVFNLEFHHKIPLKTKNGRGRDVRMWEWVVAHRNNNLSLLCNVCHKKFHNGDDVESE